MLATLGLFASALNLVRLYMSKFQARSRDVSVLRAMGARRREIFIQHLVETEMVAVAGTILGILLGKLGLRMMNALIIDRYVDYALDGTTLVTAIAVGLGAGLLAGIYPAWRMSRLPPASFLRRE